MQLKELLKAICNSTVKIVSSVIAIVVLCIYSVLLWNTYQYYTGDQYKFAVAHEIYNNLIRYTGQTMPPLIIINNPVVNAWTDGKSIVFTTGILNTLKNKDEIANVMAHEMAHNMLAHTSDLGSSLSQIDKEAHADKVGTYLMLRAGYDICLGREFWNTLRDSESGEMAKPEDHPGYSYRYYAEQMPWCQ